MKPAVIYARYSSLRQNEESIEQQVNECRKYAKEHDLRVIRVYADEAMSGRSDRRPEFQKMVRASKSHEFDVIIAYKSNRIARNMLQALTYQATFQQHGVSVVYVKEMFADNAAGRFALRSMMNLNQFYSENMGEDIKRAMHARALECKVNSGSLAYGYKKGNDGKYAINERTAPYVRRIFDMYSRGIGPAEIIQEITESGARTNKGNIFGIQSIEDIIKNKVYTGVYKWGDVEIAGGVPAIVDNETFNRCQKLKKQPKRKQPQKWNTERYILTGKLFCGECGEGMIGKSGINNKGKKYGYYNCSGRLAKKCDKSPVPKEYIENLVIDYTIEQVFSDAQIEELANEVLQQQSKDEAAQKEKEYKEELKTRETEIQNIMSAIRQSGTFSKALQNELSRLEEDAEDLRAKIEHEQGVQRFSRDEIISFLQDLKNKSRTATSTRREIVDLYVNAVYVFDDHMKICYNLSDGQNSIVPLDIIRNVRTSSVVGYHSLLVRTKTYVYVATVRF